MADREFANDALPPIDRAAAPLRRRIVDALRLAIVHGRLAPGSRLVERELIEMMGVSRTVLREALRQLESEGLIDVAPNKGAVVRALTLAEANDLYAIRAVLEGLAARLFVAHADAAHKRALEAALDAAVEAYGEGDPASINRSKNEYYEALFRGARSETLSTMIGALNARVQRWRALGLRHAQRSDKRSEESVNGLKAMVAAIKAGDGERAERIARAEVMRAAAEITRLLAQDQPPDRDKG